MILILNWNYQYFIRTTTVTCCHLHPFGNKRFTHTLNFFFVVFRSCSRSLCLSLLLALSVPLVGPSKNFRFFPLLFVNCFGHFVLCLCLLAYGLSYVSRDFFLPFWCFLTVFFFCSRCCPPFFNIAFVFEIHLSAALHILIFYGAHSTRQKLYSTVFCVMRCTGRNKTINKCFINFSVYIIIINDHCEMRIHILIVLPVNLAKTRSAKNGMEKVKRGKRPKNNSTLPLFLFYWLIYL